MPRYTRTRSRRGSRTSRRRAYRRMSYRYPRVSRGIRYVNSRDTSVSNVKIVTHVYTTMSLPINKPYTTVMSIPAFGSTNALTEGVVSGCSAISSPVYRLYTALYDEVKLRGVQYQLTFVNPTAMAATISTCNVYTSLDRRWCPGDDEPTGPIMLNTCTAAPVALTTYRVPIFKRYFSARDLIERIQYHDCTLAKTGGGGFYDEAMESEEFNPNFFSPCLYFMIHSPATFAAETQIPVNVRCVYYLTFRNPKAYSGVPDDQPAAVQAASTSTVVQPDELLDIPDPHPLSGSTAPPLTET